MPVANPRRRWRGPSVLRQFIALTALAYGLAYGQSTKKKLAFDAASVKPGNPAGGPFAMTIGGPGTKDPGRIRYSNTSLRTILLLAYGVDNFQIEGPGWMETERFDIDATMPAETTKEQFGEMLRNLLVERFKIVTHRTTRLLPAYTLVVARTGLKMAQSVPAAVVPEGGASAAAVAPGQFDHDRDGFPKLPPGGPPNMLQFVVLNRARLEGRLQTVADLADRLSYLLSYPVADGTALTGKYDFRLTFATEGTALTKATGPPLPPPGGDVPVANPGEPPPDLFSAVQSQLGLKLEKGRAAVEVIVIDRVERIPAAN